MHPWDIRWPLYKGSNQSHWKSFCWKRYCKTGDWWNAGPCNCRVERQGCCRWNRKRKSNRRRNGENKENNGENKEAKEVSPEDLAAKEVAKDIKMWLISISSTVDGLDSFVNPWSKCMYFFSTLDVFDSFLNPWSICMRVILLRLREKACKCGQLAMELTRLNIPHQEAAASLFCMFFCCFPFQILRLQGHVGQSCQKMQRPTKHCWRDPLLQEWFKCMPPYVQFQILKLFIPEFLCFRMEKGVFERHRATNILDIKMRRKDTLEASYIFT